MLAASFKRTKIVATIGPASSSPQVLEQLLLAGVNMFRLNFSHGTQEEHGEVFHAVRKLSAKHSRPAAILADLQGPKIQVGMLPADGLPFVRDHLIRFELDADYDATGIVPVRHNIAKYLKKGERIFLHDGQIVVEVEKIEKHLIATRVIAPGILLSNQGINLPDTDLGGEITTEKDLSDLKFAVDLGADYVGYSFVQTAADIENLRARLKKLQAPDMQIIAKIETAAAVEHLEAIVAATDCLMVARGDLAIETKPESVPAAQRRMIELGKRYRKPVIVATQMLESMIQSPTPTRAEVSDVATAVLEGADAVMLSAETAVGLFPVDTVKMMKRIILYTEREELPQLSSGAPAAGPDGDHTNAVSAAAVVLARQLGAKVIIAETSSGQTARNVSALRPGVPIIMVTDHERVYHQMAIVWGGKSYLADSMDGATERVIRELKSAGNVAAGDALVVASGYQPGLVGGTDRVQIKIVE